MATEIEANKTEVDLDTFLNQGVILTPEGEKKKNVFSRPDANLDVDLTKISTAKPAAEKLAAEAKPEEDEEEGKEKKPETPVDPEIQAGLDKISQGITTPEEEEETEGGNSAAGRKKLDKSLAASVTKKLIEKGLFKPFDDEDKKPIEDYTEADYLELIEANFKAKEDEVAQEVPKAFFDALPEELQYAYTYVANGGKDLKSIFKLLSNASEVRELDPSSEAGQKQIVRQWLTHTSFGSPEEIEEEINSIADRNELEKKANQFKPKLDAKQEEIIQGQIKQQEAYRKKQEKAAQQFQESVFKTLESGDLGGVKLDRKTQELLYTGLVQPVYPSASGGQTNLLGHLLEKVQFLEPNHGLLAEVLWHLADPDGFKKKIASVGADEATKQTVRKLKTEQQNKDGGGVSEEDGPQHRRTVNKSTLERPKNFFRRA